MGVPDDLLRIVKVWTIKLSKVSWVSEKSINMLVDVALTAGNEWKPLLFTPGTAVLSNKKEDGEAAGVYYQQEFKAQVPCKNLVLPDDLQEFDELCLVKAELSNGKVCLIGSTTNPVLLEHELLTDQDQVIISFTRKSIRGLYYFAF